MLKRTLALQARVMFSCNNACFFCLDRSDEDGLFHGGPAIVPAADVERVLRAQAGQVDTVIFTHGEPTLHPHLLDLARLARDLGYATRGVVTNARRLAHAPFAREVLDAGLNRFVLSIHGPDAATHDACVGRKAFVQAAAGLANLRDRKDDYDFVLTTSTVVNHLNRTKVSETVRFLLDHRVDVAVLNVVRPMGNAARFFDKVVPRYAEVVDALAHLFDLEPSSRHRVAIEDIPPCAARKVAPMLGVLEAWVAEASDESAHLPLAVPVDAGPTASLPSEPVFEVGVPGRDAVKRAACATCVHDGQCWGVWRRYVQAYGWDEFTPVTAADLETQAAASPFAASIHAAAGLAVVGPAVGPAWRLLELTIDDRRSRAVYALAHPDGRSLQVTLQPRDDTRPAFGRSLGFDLAYQGRRDLAADEVAVLRRLCAVLQAAGH